MPKREPITCPLCGERTSLRLPERDLYSHRVHPNAGGKTCNASGMSLEAARTLAYRRDMAGMLREVASRLESGDDVRFPKIMLGKLPLTGEYETRKYRLSFEAIVNEPTANKLTEMMEPHC